MNKIILSDTAFEQMHEWSKYDAKVLKKIFELIMAIKKDPIKGIGKPEPLKYYKGCWSRRITEEHRIIYSIEKDGIIIYSVKGHYD